MKATTMSSKQAKSSAIVGLEAKGIQVIDDHVEIDVASPIEAAQLDEVALLEKFMQEPVEVLIMATTDANAPPYCDLSVNGVKRVVHRNQPTVIPRCHLEVLARMKETRWVQTEIEAMRPAGMETLRGHSANCYPFTVLQDKNPRGGAWLKSILAEPA